MAGEGFQKRQKLFDLFVGQAGHKALTEGRYFICPLCRTKYEREAVGGENPGLTLAHIIPRSLGGTWETLTCKGCNNENGRDIENDMLLSQEIGDFVTGRGEIEVLLGEAGKIRATLSRGPDGTGMNFTIRTPMASPAVQAFKAQMLNAKAGDSYPFRMTLSREGRCWAAVCQSAYLLMFQYFGYDFAFNPTYEPLRQQVQNPHNRTWDGNIWVLEEPMASDLLGGKTTSVAFTTEPHRAILAVVKFVSPGGAALVLAVVLPGPGEVPHNGMTLRTITPAVVPYEPEFMGNVPDFLCWRWSRWISHHE